MVENKPKPKLRKENVSKEPVRAAELEKKSKKAMDPQKKKLISAIVFVVGFLMLVVGVVFLIINLTRGEETADADYLVAAEEWVLEDADAVIWDFTEPGKGTLTTNDHENDYNFTWVLEDDKLKIKTDWLYELENDYSYELDQNSGTLILSDDNGDVAKFVAH